MSVKNTKTYIAGGSGFIGTSVCRILEKCNSSFTILDVATSQLFADKTLLCDVRQSNSYPAQLHQGCMLNLAAVHRDDIADPNEYYATNVDGARVLCEVCEEKGINKIVFTSSVAVYGFAPPRTGGKWYDKSI